jgi:hypothetical protein
MPPSAYPSRATLLPLFEEELAPSYAVTESAAFVDGGRDHNLDADKKVRRFRLVYDGHTEAEIATLDTHADDAKVSDEASSAYGFNFTTRSGEVVGNVHYSAGGYSRTHSKLHSQRREVNLVKFP